MTREEIYSIWAPPSSAWAPWVSPVPFASLECGDPIGGAFVPVNKGEWLPQAAEQNTGLIINLRGDHSLGLALALAKRGWRPVPVFNASPSHIRETISPSGQTLENVEVIDTIRIRNLLCQLAPALATLNLPDSAPPAFLIDSQRLTGSQLPEPGMFDNRWKLYPQDFPSGEVLRRNEVKRIGVIREALGDYAEDLRAILLTWQTEGIEIWESLPAYSSTLRRTEIRPLSVFQKMWFRLRTSLVRRHKDGSGFGRFISAGG
jgi:hypothetical protein